MADIVSAIGVPSIDRSTYTPSFGYGSRDFTGSRFRITDKKTTYYVDKWIRPAHTGTILSGAQ